MMKNTHAFLLSALCCLTLSACNEQNSQSLEQSNLNDFTLTSSKVSDGGNLPITYTCDGQSISPPLNWSDAPNTTKYYALIMDHKAPEGMHWY